MKKEMYQVCVETVADKIFISQGDNEIVIIPDQVECLMRLLIDTRHELSNQTSLSHSVPEVDSDGR